MKTVKIQLPQKMEAYNIKSEVEGGYIVTTYELRAKAPEYKNGDVLVAEAIPEGERLPFIFKGKDGYKYKYHAGITLGLKDVFKLAPDSSSFYSNVIGYATEEEKQLLLDKMHEQGKDFDFGKMEIVPYKWRGENGEHEYYFVNFDGKVYISIDLSVKADNNRYEVGNYFRTEEEAKASKFYKVFHENDGIDR